MENSISRQMGSLLAPEIINFTKQAADIAARRGMRLYLVGGAVRDLLLGKGSRDLDPEIRNFDPRGPPSQTRSVANFSEPDV